MARYEQWVWSRRDIARKEGTSRFPGGPGDKGRRLSSAEVAALRGNPSSMAEQGRLADASLEEANRIAAEIRREREAWRVLHTAAEYEALRAMPAKERAKLRRR